MDALTDADQVKGVSIKQSWDLGKEYIEGVSIVKKKLKSNSTYYYFVEVKYKAGTSTGVDNISGEINLKKSTATMDGVTVSGKAFVAVLGISGTYSFPEADTLTGIDAEETLLYNFSSSGLLYGFDGEQTFDFESGHYFDVDLTGQGKILIYYDEKYNASVAAAYPYANLDFVNFNGATFNKTGELTLLADEGSYLYALNADGSLSKIKSEYDEYEEAFKITTRTLGKYVISDTELKLVAASTSSTAPAGSEATAEVKPNPGTGAAA
jgi:hypothetical protein